MVDERLDATEDPGEPEIGLGLHWRIKDSFVRYVLSLADGSYAVTEGADDDGNGNFFFPLESAHRNPDCGWELRFRGDVRFAGHFGALFVPLVDPLVRLGAVTGSLSLRDISATDPNHIAIAQVANVEPRAVDGLLAWPALASTLTAAGVSLLGDVYPLGSPIDPLRIVIGVD